MDMYFHLRLLLFIAITISAFAGLLKDGQAQTYPGGGAVGLPSDEINFDEIPKHRFGRFAEEGVRRFFALGQSYKITGSESGYSFIREFVVSGESRCLVPRLRGPWQRFKIEIMYIVDDAHLSASGKKRYNLVVRFLAGEFADFAQDGEPPADRIKQFAPAELTTLGRLFAESFKLEIEKLCFKKQLLDFCEPSRKEICR